MTAKDENGNTITACNLPREMTGKEAEVHTALHGMHCSHPDRKDSNHKCCGEVTINRKSATMKCIKCGDSKAVFKQ